MSAIDDLAGVSFCYLTTTGRRTGDLHEIEIWFGLAGSTAYVMSGGGERSDWVKNLRVNPAVSVRIDGRPFSGSARIVQDPEEEAMVRHLLAAKYQGWEEGGELSAWARTALPVALDLRDRSE